MNTPDKIPVYKQWWNNLSLIEKEEAIRFAKFHNLIINSTVENINDNIIYYVYDNKDKLRQPITISKNMAIALIQAQVVNAKDYELTDILSTLGFSIDKDLPLYNKIITVE